MKTKNANIINSPGDIRFEQLAEHSSLDSHIWTENPPGYLVYYINRTKTLRITFSARFFEDTTSSEKDARILKVFSTKETISPQQIREIIFEHYQKIRSEGLPFIDKTVVDALAGT